MHGPERQIPVGKIVALHGVRGTVKYLAFSGAADHLVPGSAIDLQLRNGRIETHTIAWTKPHNRYLLLALEGINDRAAAAELKNAVYLVDRSVLPELDEDTYYWADLIGVAVYTLEGRYLGCVRDIIETGANDVYVVADSDNEILIPAISAVIKTVDIHKGRIEVQLPAGL